MTDEPGKTPEPPGPPVPPEADDPTSLADAVVARALARATAAGALGGLALGTLALLFLVLADGRLDARSLPQLLVLGVGQVAGLVCAAGCALRLRAVGTIPGSGLCAGAAELLSRLVLVVVALGLVAAAGSVAAVQPRDTSAFSALLSLALLSQLVLVLHVQRRGLLRAVRAASRQ